MDVSIHAPWEGCDAVLVSMLSFIEVFQFTHPGKGATPLGKNFVYDYRFQFTHPGKGATTDPLIVVKGSLVSIHAPWEGCDFLLREKAPPTPKVSIHAPWEGCDELHKT